MTSWKAYRFSITFRGRKPWVSLDKVTLIEHKNDWPPKRPYPATLDSYHAMEQDL